MFALWPKGFEGETDGLRVLDTGSLLTYFSHEDDKGFYDLKYGTIDNPDYACVPNSSECELIYNGKTHHYLNRFYELQF